MPVLKQTSTADHRVKLMLISRGICRFAELEKLAKENEVALLAECQEEADKKAAKKHRKSHRGHQKNKKKKGKQDSTAAEIPEADTVDIPPAESSNQEIAETPLVDESAELDQHPTFGTPVSTANELKRAEVDVDQLARDSSRGGAQDTKGHSEADDMVQKQQEGYREGKQASESVPEASKSHPSHSVLVHADSRSEIIQEALDTLQAGCQSSEADRQNSEERGHSLLHAFYAPCLKNVMLSHSVWHDSVHGLVRP